MPEEKVIYEKGKIKITNLRAIFGDKTYAMSNITSVEKGSIAPDNSLSIILLILGLTIFFLAFIAMSSIRLGMWLLGAVMVFGAIGKWLLGSQAEHYVQFASSAGEIKAHTSDDETEIKQIVAAINQAMITQE